MKIKAIIIEDEFPARRTIKSYLSRYFPIVEIVGEAGEMKSARALLAEGEFDFVFLDVHLKDGNGIDLLSEEFSNKLRVIFTTAYDQYALQAFSQKAFGYLLKPLNPVDFKEIVNRVLKDVLMVNTEHIKLKVSTSHGFAYIDTSVISHCVAESNYSNILCLNGKTYLVSKTLKLIEEELDRTRKFVRIHQSYLVNLDFVDEQKIESNSITLKSGEQLPVSRSRREELLAKLETNRN